MNSVKAHINHNIHHTRGRSGGGIKEEYMCYIRGIRRLEEPDTNVWHVNYPNYHLIPLQIGFADVVLLAQGLTYPSP